MQRIREAAEKAKIELSSSQQTSVNLPYITVDAEKNPLFMDETITRAQFQKLTADLLERTRTPFKQVLSDAGVAARDRPRGPRGWFHPHAGRRGPGQGARRQGAEQGR